MSDCGRGLSVRPRTGIGFLRGTEVDGTGRLEALDIAAFKTRASGGLTPHAKHGAKGVCSLAVVGSKFGGTGLEKEQMRHIQVAVLAGEGSGAGRWNGLSARDSGDAVALLDGVLRFDIARFCIEDCIEDRLDGFGTRVIFGEDFKKPACSDVRRRISFQGRIQKVYIKFVSINLFQIDCRRVLSRIVIIDIAYSM
jgi:hypothetical protein